MKHPSYSLKTLALPALLFLAALFLDNMATAQGTNAYMTTSREGDPIVVFLWNTFGDARMLLPLFWALAVLGLGYILWILRPLFGYWILYGAAFGHFIAFLSWTPAYVLSNIVFFSKDPWINVLALIIVSAILGLFFALLQLGITGKTSRSQ